MFRHLMILPDGRELFSGDDRISALQTVKLTQSVNCGQELTPGSVCAAMMEAQVIAADEGIVLTAGAPVILYRVDEKNARTLMGTFYLEQPARSGGHSLTLTAFDGVSLLDADMTNWLTELEQWPYTVQEFARMVCNHCGLELIQTQLPNGDFYIQPFTGQVTGRQLMQWLGQITGRFCRMTPEGQLEFAWYVPNEAVQLQPEGATFYYEGSLQYADYQVAPVEKVQLRQSAEDIGTVYPQIFEAKNTYIVENNPMLVASDGEHLMAVAQTLYEQMCTATYTPGSVTIPATTQVQVGDILTVTDTNGKTVTLWIMEKISDGQTATVRAVGSHRRDSSTAVNNAGYRALSGKVLNLRWDVDGIRTENRDTQGRIAALKLDLEGIQSKVVSQESTLQGLTETVSTLTQDAESLTLTLDSIRQNGTDRVKTTQGYTFDDAGLHISRSDSPMENTLDHTGMYVRRSGQTVLQANNQGVEAVDVTVRNYLIVGSNTRLEDYGGDRTACFFVG